MDIVKQLVKQGASVDHQDEVVSNDHDGHDGRDGRDAHDCDGDLLGMMISITSTGILHCTRPRGKGSARRSPSFARLRYFCP